MGQITIKTPNRVEIAMLCEMALKGAETNRGRSFVIDVANRYETIWQAVDNAEAQKAQSKGNDSDGQKDTGQSTDDSGQQTAL